MPALILQPLVENAVKHGLGTTSATVTLTLAALEVGDRLQVTVTDWTAGERSPFDNVSSSHGIGLANVRDRLTTRYGDYASLDASATAHGWQNTVMLPLSGSNVA